MQYFLLAVKSTYHKHASGSQISIRQEKGYILSEIWLLQGATIRDVIISSSWLNSVSLNSHCNTLLYPDLSVWNIHGYLRQAKKIRYVHSAPQYTSDTSSLSKHRKTLHKNKHTNKDRDLKVLKGILSFFHYYNISLYIMQNNRNKAFEFCQMGSPRPE